MLRNSTLHKTFQLLLYLNCMKGQAKTRSFSRKIYPPPKKKIKSKTIKQNAFVLKNVVSIVSKMQFKNFKKRYRTKTVSFLFVHTSQIYINITITKQMKQCYMILHKQPIWQCLRAFKFKRINTTVQKF